MSTNHSNVRSGQLDTPRWHSLARGIAVVLAGAVGFAGNAIRSGSDPIDASQFTELHALIKPKEEESRWEQIPWLTSLWEARQRAAREGKPILLWEMDGHPLGCT